MPHCKTRPALLAACLLPLAGLLGCDDPDTEDGVVNPPLHKEQITAPAASPPPEQAGTQSRTRHQAQDIALVRLAPASGSNVEGEATFTQVGDKVRMALELSGLAPGEHAVHIHARGDCAAPDASSAGGHWSPREQEHGEWGDAQHHLGDIGNVTADAQGQARLSFATPAWTLDDGPRSVLGQALIVHAGADDYESQPAGDAGKRVACGVIRAAA